MKNKIIGIFVCVLVLMSAILPVLGTRDTRGLSDAKQTMVYAPGELIVKLKKDVTFSSLSLKTLSEKHQVYAPEKVFPNSEGTILNNIYLVHVPLGVDILSLVQEYETCPDVVYAEPNWIAFPYSIPNDENFSKQWYLQNTGQIILENISGTPDADIYASEAWDIETGNPDVVVAIIDSGIDYTHPDLRAKIWNNTDEIPSNGIDDDQNGYIDDIRGWDFYYNDNNITDGYGHGTMCAGVAAASTNNKIGISGVGWNCMIMPLRIFNETGNTTGQLFAVQAIKYAVDNGAKVISMSFGGSNVPKTLQDAVNYAYAKGVFLCAAAGNYDTAVKSYPAACENVTAVAATNQNDKRCSPQDWGTGAGSNYGNWVDIAAPGNLIYTTLPTYQVYFNKLGAKQNYDYGDGTSFAAPMVAGVAALLISKDPSLTPDAVTTILSGNVDPYNSNEYIGSGRLNAQKALAALFLSNLPPNPPTITGPSKGKLGATIQYHFTTIDPEGDKVYYFIDWGDNSKGSWIGPYPSDNEITELHTWSTKGTYTIQAKAKDIYGNESDWATLTVTMPYSYKPMPQFLELLFQRFPNTFPLLQQ